MKAPVLQPPTLETLRWVLLQLPVLAGKVHSSKLKPVNILGPVEIANNLVRTVEMPG